MVHDFRIKHDFDTEKDENLIKKIIYNLTLKRLKGHKPCIIGIFGKSSEGKSYAGLRIQEILAELNGFNLKENLEVANVFLPIEYPEKINKLLNDEKYKKVCVICMHEARTVISAKLWFDFVTQAIADINAVHRRIKPLVVIIISQSINDITKEMRTTLDYYIKATRPINDRTRLKIYSFWEDDTDIANIKLRKRKIKGIIVNPDGSMRKFRPMYWELRKPSKEIAKAFDKIDLLSKKEIFQKRIKDMVSKMKMDLNLPEKKIDNIVDFYMQNPNNLLTIIEKRQGKIRIKKDVMDFHDLNKNELVMLEKKFRERNLVQ
jgi:hypothetical protein